MHSTDIMLHTSLAAADSVVAPATHASAEALKELLCLLILALALLAARMTSGTHALLQVMVACMHRVSM